MHKFSIFTFQTYRDKMSIRYNWQIIILVKVHEDVPTSVDLSKILVSYSLQDNGNAQIQT